MMRSLSAGAAALSLIAGAALAQQAYDSTISRTTTTQTAPILPPAQVDNATSTTTTVRKKIDPYTGAMIEQRETTESATPPTVAVNPNAAFDPSRSSSYHEERVISPSGQVIEKSSTSETATPTHRSTTYSRTTTTKTGGDD